MSLPTTAFTTDVSSATVVLARWQVGLTDLKNAKTREFREQGYQVSHEAQNHFTIKGKLATIAGKPDLIARQGDLVWVTDVKSGRPRNRAEKPWLGREISAVKPRRTESGTIAVRAGPRRKWP